MLRDYKPLNDLPLDFKQNWMAELHKAAKNDNGSFHLVNVRRTEPKTFEELRIVVSVVDENGFPISGTNVAFSYSTAAEYEVGPLFTWAPPAPHQADVFPTEGSGQVDHVQGSIVQKGEAGGITVYVLDPRYSSDCITGAGALFDHTGMHLTFQLRRKGIMPLAQRLADIEARLTRLEGV